MTGPRPRIAVVYNEPFLPPEHPDHASEADVVTVAEAVAQALRETGFSPTLLAAGPPLAGFLDRLKASNSELVFNLIEGFGGRSDGATHLTSVFELLEIPYTGSPVEALAACVSKEHAKALLRGCGIPTARSLRIGHDDPLPHLEGWGTVLVKPDAEDGSLGIDQQSIVTDSPAIERQVRRLQKAYGGSVLIEAYLPGPEFNVGVVALPTPRALPVAQVVFASGTGQWPILTYAAKWNEGSAEDLASPVVCPASIERELADRLGTLAVSAFRMTGCRDYARVDFRLDDRGEPMVLEVNPNPDIGPNAGLARAAAVSGIVYRDLIAAIAREAAKRGPGACIPLT